MPLQSCPVHTIIELYIELIYGTWRVTYYVCRTSNKRADEDVLGVSYSCIADGSIVQNGTINIKEICIGSGENEIVLHNKTATVALNQIAPILLGNEVLDELASVEVDNVSKTINFYKK